MVQCLGFTTTGERCRHGGLHRGYCWRHVPGGDRPPADAAAPAAPRRPPIPHADLVRIRAMKARLARGVARDDRIGDAVARILGVPEDDDRAVEFRFDPGWTADALAGALGVPVAPWFVVRDAYVENYVI